MLINQIVDLLIVLLIIVRDNVSQYVQLVKTLLEILELINARVHVLGRLGLIFLKIFLLNYVSLTALKILLFMLITQVLAVLLFVQTTIMQLSQQELVNTAVQTIFIKIMIRELVFLIAQ